MMPAIKKTFNLLGVDIVEIYEEKWLEESKAGLLQQIDDEKTAKIIMSRMKKQMKKIDNA